MDERDGLFLTLAVLALGIASVTASRILKVHGDRLDASEADIAFLRAAMKTLDAERSE